MNVVLVEPQIPPNTGNIARLCAATRVRLHLVGRLGFELSDRHLRRAGLDYWPWVTLEVHPSLEAFLAEIPDEQLLLFSTKAKTSYLSADFREDSFLIFGNETQGLPEWTFSRYPERFWTIPMMEPAIRSLNLSSAVAVVVYEGLRRLGKIKIPLKDSESPSSV